MTYSNFSNSKFTELLEKTTEIGFVEEVNHPVVTINGLPSLKPNELVLFENDTYGQVLSLGKDTATIIVFSTQPINTGTRATRTERQIEIAISKNLLGRVVDPFGSPLDQQPPDHVPVEYRPIDSAPPKINHRAKISKPFLTGVTVVDLMIPLGKGQRSLIIGDRKTGKTNFLLQTMMTQSQEGSICIYAATGKRMHEIRSIEQFLREHGLSERSILIASSAADPLGHIYVTPFSAMTIAEYFRDQGNDVVLIIDDLATHAKFYREISLTAGKFPGRNSYPGDIFYTHARLLERAGNFKVGKNKIQSITCLPIAETTEGNISGYIQTNLMSITDGHIYFDSNLFAQGRRPAVNYFLSVTRVGRQTQSLIRWGINRELNTYLKFLEKTQSFVHFGAEINEGIKTLLAMGDRIISFFNQHMTTVLPINVQILLFSLIWMGTWQNVSKGEMSSDIQRISEKYESDSIYRNEVDELINKSKDFNAFLGTLSKRSQSFLAK